MEKNILVDFQIYISILLRVSIVKNEFGHSGQRTLKLIASEGRKDRINLFLLFIKKGYTLKCFFQIIS